MAYDYLQALAELENRSKLEELIDLVKNPSARCRCARRRHCVAVRGADVALAPIADTLRAALRWKLVG